MLAHATGVWQERRAGWRALVRGGWHSKECGRRDFIGAVAVPFTRQEIYAA